MNQENLSGQQQKVRAKSREKAPNFAAQVQNTSGFVQSLTYNQQSATENQKQFLANIPILSPASQTQASELGMQGSRQAGIGISNLNEVSDQQNVITSAKNQSRTTQYKLTQKENFGSQKQKKEGKTLELQAYQGSSSNQSKNVDSLISGQNNFQKRGTTPVRFNQKQVIQNTLNNQNKIVPSSAKAINSVKTKSSNIQQIKGLMAAAVASVKQNPNLQNKLANQQQQNFSNLHFTANGQLKTLSDNSPKNQDNQNYYIDMLQACYDPNAVKNSSSQSSVSAIKGLISQNNNNYQSYKQYLGGHAQSIDKKHGEGELSIDKAYSEKLQGGKNYQDLDHLTSFQQENKEIGSRKALVGLQAQPDGFVSYPEDQIGNQQLEKLCIREDEMALKMFDAYQKGIDEDNEDQDNQHNSSDYVNTENENEVNGEIFEQAVDFEFCENQEELDQDDQAQRNFLQNQEQYDNNQVKQSKRANQNLNNKSLKVSRKRSALKSEERRVVSQQDFKTIQQSHSGIGGMNNGGTPHQYNPNNLIIEYNTNNKHLISGNLVGGVSGDEKEIFGKGQKQKYPKGRSKSRSQNKRREISSNHEYSASQQKRNSRASIGKNKNQGAIQLPIQSDGPANLVLTVNNGKGASYQNKIQRPLSVDRLSGIIEDGFQKTIAHSKQKANKLVSGVQSISSTKQSANQKLLNFAQIQILGNEQIKIHPNGTQQSAINAMASFQNSNNLTQLVQKNQFELTEMTQNQFHQTNNSLQQANQILIKQILNNQDLRNANTVVCNEISPSAENNQQQIQFQSDSIMQNYNQNLVQVQKRMNIFEDEIINRIREIQKYTKGLNSVIRKQIIPKQEEHSQLIINFQMQLENTNQIGQKSHRNSEQNNLKSDRQENQNKLQHEDLEKLSSHFEDQIQRLYQFCEENAFTQEFKEGILSNNEALEGIQEKLIEQNQLITMLDDQIGNTDDRIEQLQKVINILQEQTPSSERVLPSSGVLNEIQQLLDQQSKRINEIDQQCKVSQLGELKSEIEQKLKDIAEQLLRQAEEGEGRDGLILQQNTDITNLFQAHEQILENQRQFKDQFESMDRITQEISEVQNELQEQVQNLGQDLEGQVQQFMSRNDIETILQDKITQLEEFVNNKMDQADENTHKMEQLREYFEQRLQLTIETLKQEVQSSLENTANQMNDNFDHIQSLLENQQIDLDGLQQEAAKYEQQKLNYEQIAKKYAEKTDLAQTNQNIQTLKHEFNASLQNLNIDLENIKQTSDIGSVEKQLQKLQLEVSQSLVNQQSQLRDNVDTLNDQFSGFQEQIDLVIEKVNQLCESIDPIQQEISEIGNKNELKLEEFKGKILNDIKFINQPNEMSATQQFLTYKTELQLLKTNFMQIDSAFNQQNNQVTQVQIDFQKLKSQVQEFAFNQKPDFSSEQSFKKEIQLLQDRIQKEIKNESEKFERQIDEIEIQIKKIYLEQKESLENIKQKMNDDILLPKNELLQDLTYKQEQFHGDILTMKNILSIIQDSQFQQQIDQIHQQINKLQKAQNSQAIQRVSVQPLSTLKQDEQIFMQPFKSHRANIHRQQLTDIDFEEEYSQNKSQHEFVPIMKQAPRNNINLSPIAIVNNDKSSNGGTEHAHQLLQGYLAKPRVPLINLDGINLNLEIKEDKVFHNSDKNSYSDDQFGSSVVTPDIPTKFENTSFMADHNFICEQVMQIIDFDSLVHDQINYMLSQIQK